MNYQNLYNCVIDYLARDDVSYGLFDTWLRIVEKKLNARLTACTDYTIWRTRLENGSVKLPDDFKQGTITKMGDQAAVLQYCPPQSFEEKRDIPGYFTIKNDRLYVSGNIGGCGITLEYDRRITPLTQDAPENDVSRCYPDLYLFGVLKEAGIWAKDAGAIQAYAGHFEEALHEANAQSTASAVSGSQLVMVSDLTYIGGQ